MAPGGHYPYPHTSNGGSGQNGTVHLMGGSRRRQLGAFAANQAAFSRTIRPRPINMDERLPVRRAQHHVHPLMHTLVVMHMHTCMHGHKHIPHHTTPQVVFTRAASRRRGRRGLGRRGSEGSGSEDDEDRCARKGWCW